MTLNELYKSYKKVANKLSFYLKDTTDNTYKYVGFAQLTRNNGADLKSERYGITRPQLAQMIANMYCDAEEIIFMHKEDDLTKAEQQRDKTFAAWMCLYWYRTLEWKLNSTSLNLEEEEFAQVWLMHCIDACLYYRPWRPIRIDHKHQKKTGEFIYIENPQYKPNEVNSVDKSMNHWILLERARRYQDLNKNKRKLNQQTYKLDDIYNQGNEMDRDSKFAVNEKYYNSIDELTEMFTQKGRILEGLVIKALAYGNAVKYSKKTEKALSLRGVSKYIKNMTLKDVSYFADKFNVNNNEVLDIISKLSSDKVKNAFEIAKAILLQKKDEVRSMLCNN